MYITVRSGHYQAARSLEEGLRRLNPRAEILTIDAFSYLNPVLARIVDRMYLSVIQKLPELWDYLYDNPKVVQRSERLRQLLHRYDSPRLKALLEEFQPDVIACTQAFPCGLVADYKKQFGLSIPLYAVITDFLPHAYWVHPQVDGYIVGAEESAKWLIARKVDPEKIHRFGIPIDPRFAEPSPTETIRRRLQLSPGVPTILLMGGGQGLGPILEAVIALDKIDRPLQLAVVVGSNERLYHRLITQVPRLKHAVHVFGHVEFIADLMGVADLIITKPGGLTTSEALAKGLPLVILSPIPGQEIKNADFLIRSGVARQADSPEELAPLVSSFLADPRTLAQLAAQAKSLGRPRAALDAAELLLNRDGA
jgi:processive 1,2-diacylglycerol beta-glucosyltransferase